MARASHIDARAIYCLQAAGGVSVLCLEVFLDPGDGTLGILSEVDVLFALGRQQRDAQAVGVGLHLVVIGANLRSQDDDVVLVHDGVVAAVGTGVGGNVDAQLVGAFLKRVGEQCRGAGASAQNQNPQILALKGGRSCGGLSGRSGLDNRSLNGGGGSGLDGLGLLGLFFGQGLGLLLAQDVVVGLAERVVD